MANQSTFPTTLDGTPTDKAAGDLVPSSQWNQYLDGVVELEDKVGINTSTDNTTLDWKLTSAGSWNPGHKHTAIYNSAGTVLICAKANELYFTRKWFMQGTSYPWNWPSSATSGTVDGQMIFDTTGNAKIWPIYYKDYISSDITLVSTTTGCATDIGFPVAANEVWWFDYMVLCTAPAAADHKFIMDGPAGFNTTWGTQYVWYSNDVGDTSTPGAMNTSATAQTVSASGTSNVQIFTIKGWVFNGANAGSAGLVYAQATSNTGTNTMYAGSHVIAMRLI